MASLLKCLIPTIGSPKTLNGKESRYELAAFYGELLAMRIVHEGWLLLGTGGPSKFFIALDGDGWDDRRPPRWPDPEYPQQLHLDLVVPDVGASGALVTELGGSLLRDTDDFRVYADPAGHPFCLYPDPSAARPAVSRVVFDCYSPRAMATFYEEFLQSPGRLEDTAQRVVIDLDDEQLPNLAFQHAQFRAARWPEPGYPAQLHVDYRWHDSLTARFALERAERLGAVELADTGVYGDPAAHPFCIQNEIPWAYAIVGLYVYPPEYAVVYCVDTGVGKPQSGPRERRDTAGGPELAGMFDAIDIVAGPAVGAPDRVAAFMDFLTTTDAAVPDHLAVNLVCDWADTYNAPDVQGWLADHPRVLAHRNPPELDWPEPAARWFAHVTGELTDRDDLAAEALAADIRAHIRAWNTNPLPFTWTRSGQQILDSLPRPRD